MYVRNHFNSFLCFISLRREMIIEARCCEHVAQLAAVLPVLGEADELLFLVYIFADCMD